MATQSKNGVFFSQLEGLTPVIKVKNYLPLGH